MVQRLTSDESGGLRRTVAIVVIVAGLVLLAFIVWITVKLSGSNAWSEIAHVVGPVVGWLVLALVTAFFAALASRSERRHAVNVATAGAEANSAAAASSAAAGTVTPAAVVVASQPWRGSALAGLAVLAFSMALVSSSQLGHLRSATQFELRAKDNVAWCTQRECTAAERAAACTGTTPCFENIAACDATLSAPASAMTKEPVPIDLSVYCGHAKPQQMPVAKADYGSKGDDVVLSFAAAKTTWQNERVWRWFVKLPPGEQPIDVHLTFVGDTIAVPLARIVVSQPTTLAGLTESTTAIGGFITAVIGLFGTLGALVKGLRGTSATVVTPNES